ncbi:TPA: hypothetical protein ACGJUA_006509 [Pseudomonas aeruginosa]|uniref:hypothetical protein n=1 Tax=Pseudomonas aeruginosa group TaxID=136841 RepID=UPI000F4E42BB|nr:MULTISPECIES: hypothetical protein [Pseudomonas aeruginosa group]MCT9630653.1 hypothetical protein [Pseudomonas aeruginosa]MCW8031844.1 hypothetical protein [Pseudomonas aeruginosa]MDV2883312.1 hypothetical protein [Pseudomonas aeruginosa]HCE6465902.1 hypothetical protein [Pseudomonas aeruginosa]
MNSGMKVGRGGPGSGGNVLCALPQSVQNIRNIQKEEEKHQQKQGHTRENLFHHYRNKPASTGTQLIPFVQAFLGLPEHSLERYSLSATRLPAIHWKTPVQNVPPVPEHFKNSGGRAIRGFQPCT